MMNKVMTVRMTEEESAILETVCHNEGIRKSDLIRMKIREMAGPTSDLSEWD